MNPQDFTSPSPIRAFFVGITLLFACGAHGADYVAPPDKARVLVLTDISNEPDDEESLVRFLVYSNEYDVEGLIATTSIWLRQGPREDLIRRQIGAYGEVRANLLKQAPGFPEAAQLLAVTCTGQTGYGLKDVGPSHASAGSRRIITAVDKEDWACLEKVDTNLGGFDVV